MFQKWIDHMISWDPNHYNGVSKIYVEAHNVWHPKLALPHS